MALHGKGSLIQGIDGPSTPTGVGQAGSTSGAGNRKNKIVAGVCVGAIIVLAAFIVMNFLGGQTAAAASETRPVIDSETGEIIENFRIPDGGSFPYVNPKTGKNTLYLAEKCFWAKDGTIKDKPTYVLLNKYINKPEPTLCPDCGRPVRGHNPYPVIK
jgi:hypothetical protein